MYRNKNELIRAVKLCDVLPLKLTSCFFNVIMLTLILLTTFLSPVYGADLPVHCENKDNNTCIYQLPYRNLSSEDCQVEKIPDCKDVLFRYNDKTTLGKVRLEATYYLYGNGFSSTKLNASVSEVNFNYLRMQYKRRRDADLKKSFCRAFNLSSRINLPLSTSLFYDCIWSEQEYEGVEYDFKYEAHNRNTDQFEGRHYIFRVPYSTNIQPHKTSLENWEVFMYIDISSLPELIVRWQGAPDYFGVKAYRVGVYRGTNDTPYYQTASVEVPADDGLFYSESIGMSSGKYYFTIQIVHDSCKNCYVTKSPVIIIDNPNNLTMLIGIVGSVVLLPVFLYAFYIWKRYGLLKRGHTPVVLILYKPTRNTHIKAIVALANYLRDVCHIESLLDEIHIPLSEEKDPFIWYQESFTRADTIMVVSSPPQVSNSDAGIYHNVDTVALRILAEKFSDYKSQQKFLSVVVPYCKESDLPGEAKCLSRFYLMKDLNEMLWYIHHGTRSSIVSKVEYFLFQSHVTGGKTDFKRHGQTLTDALTVAKLDTVKIYCADSNDFKKSYSRIDLLQQFDSVALLPKAENKISFDPPKHDPNMEDIFGIYPGNINNLNLDGNKEENLNPGNATKSLSDTEFDINDLPL